VIVLLAATPAITKFVAVTPPESVNPVVLSVSVEAATAFAPPCAVTVNVVLEENPTPPDLAPPTANP
jgi:hypothetical protein